MREVKLGQAANVMLFVSTLDHITPKTGAILSVSLSKNGGAFSPIAPVVTERGFGWYSVALTGLHTDTEGDLIVRAVAADADPAERCLVVYSTKAADAVRVGGTLQSPGDLAALVADVASEDNLNAVGALVAGTATAEALALVAAAVAAKASQQSLNEFAAQAATGDGLDEVREIVQYLEDLARGDLVRLWVPGVKPEEGIAYLVTYLPGTKTEILRKRLRNVEGKDLPRPTDKTAVMGEDADEANYVSTGP